MSSISFEKLKNKKLFEDRGNFINKSKREIIYRDFFQIKKHFSGASPPEIFIGRYNYPNINAGILSPDFFGDTEELSMPEIWHEKNFSIEDILKRRTKLIYGRFKTHIKIEKEKKFIDVLKNLAIAYKPI